MFGRRREDRRKKNTIMAVKFKSMAALALSAAMLLSMAACGFQRLGEFIKHHHRL